MIAMGPDCLEPGISGLAGAVAQIASTITNINTGVRFWDIELYLILQGFNYFA